MLVGLISDTHSAGSGRDLPVKVLNALHGVDLILHCGDLECLGVLDFLETVAPVLAVRGYEDPVEFNDGGRERLARTTRVVEIEGAAIGMVHDIQWPGPRVIPRLGGGKAPGLDFPPGRPRELLAQKFGQPVDVVVFGDTHQEMIENCDGVLVVNPGSPTYPTRRRAGGPLGTIALLEVSRGSVSVRMVELEADG